MTKKVFRPFWSYDVQATEKWLSAMAAKGYHLQALKRGSIFVFIAGEQKNATYFIGYRKLAGNPLAASLQDDGWFNVSSRGKWVVSANENPVEQIKIYPLRDDGFLSRNRTIMYITGFFAITHFFMFFILNLLRFADFTTTFVPSPFWAVHVLFYTFVYYSFIKLYFANKRLKYERGEKENISANLSPDVEEAYQRHGRLIKRVKLGWMYDPDKLERWLEQMEEQGYNLYRVGWSGTVFYFVEGKPRQVKYYADFHNKTDDSYFHIHQDAGWKVVFTRSSIFEQWTILSREYQKGEDKPQLYSDTSDVLQSARRVAVTYSAIFVPMIMIYGASIALQINAMLTYDRPFSSTPIILFGISILLFGSMTVRTWLYYRRLRDRLSTESDK
jgi:hypothetical protein